MPTQNSFKVLGLCAHNSARSVIAQDLLEQLNYDTSSLRSRSLEELQKRLDEIGRAIVPAPGKL